MHKNLESPNPALSIGREVCSSEEKLRFFLYQRNPSPPHPTCLLQIHAFLLRRSLHTNLPLLTLLISSFADLAFSSSPSAASSLFRHARRIFDHRTTQDTVLCNSMIRALVQHRRFRESIALYRNLRTEPTPPVGPSFSPDSYTFPFLLKSCASFRKPAEQREGIQLHTHVIKMGFCYDAFASTGLVDMYAKHGDMDSARKLFDGVPERSLASWTSMADGYARSGDASTAIELFWLMPERDVAAFNAMIDVLVKLVDMASAWKLFNAMPLRNVVSWTSLISGYSKMGNMDAARLLFDQMPDKNLFSWNVMIGGYCQNRQPNRALELFQELQSDSSPFHPDEVTVVSVIPAVSSIGAIDIGRWIHNFVRRKGLDHGVNVSTALVDMYLKCGDVCEGIQVFDRMPKKETAFWNAMINGLAVNGLAKEALDVFMDMQRKGDRPNEVTMIGVLSACTHGGMVEEGRRWFREMESLGVNRRVEHYGCMVDLLGRGGYLDEAERLIEEMPWNANGIILSSLLFACGCYGDVDRAERVMRMAARVEPGSVMNRVMLRNLYAKEKRWRDVERIKEEMRRFGGKKEAGCSVIEVGRRVWEFVAGDATAHSELEVIYRILGHLQLHMRGQRGEEEWESEVIRLN